MAMPRPRWPHLLREVSRHGTVRWVVRVGHGARTPLTAAYGTPEFEAQYHAAIRGEIIKPKIKRQEGTLAWLIARYQASSEWKNEFSDGTRKKRGQLYKQTLVTAGEMPYAEITSKHIKTGVENLVNAGVSEAELDAIMGWSPGSGMSRVYTRGRDTERLARQAANKLTTSYSQPNSKVGNEN